MQKNATTFDLSGAELERPRVTLAEAAADKLREFILLEKLPPGATISEREVSAALGISRTPLRGALALLEQEGLVEYTVTRRPRVADPSLEEVADNLVVMGAIEALGGELACANATEADISDIVELDRKMQRAEVTGVDPLDFFRTDMAFHETIVGASQNKSLVETHRQYNARLWRARFISSRRSDGRDLTLKEHGEIVCALLERDGKRTAEAMRAHLVSAVQNIKTAMQERNKLIKGTGL